MAPVHFPFRIKRLGAGALCGALVLAACGGGSRHSATDPTVTTPKVLAVKTSILRIGSVDVESAGPQEQIPTAVGKAVLTSAQAYIDNAMFSPLQNGTIGVHYPYLFDSGVKPAATGADEGALTDLGVGKVEKLSTTATPVALSALVGNLGDFMYVATNFDVVVKGNVDAGPLTITHHVELTFAPQGKAWLVTAYRVQTVRKLPTTTQNTTANAGAKP